MSLGLWTRLWRPCKYSKNTHHTALSWGFSVARPGRYNLTQMALLSLWCCHDQGEHPGSVDLGLSLVDTGCLVPSPPSPQPACLHAGALEANPRQDPSADCLFGSQGNIGNRNIRWERESGKSRMKRRGGCPPVTAVENRCSSQHRACTTGAGGGTASQKLWLVQSLADHHHAPQLLHFPGRCFCAIGPEGTSGIGDKVG